MQCPKCQFDNVEDASFCSKCGTKLEITCPECGRKLAPDSNFCNKCGHDLRKPAEAPTKDLSFDEKLTKIQRYLPEGLADKILAQRDRIEGERREVTVMFCDLEGFTALTGRLGPEEAYSVMDQVYEILIHKVHDFGGTVNEMTGDGVVALFGAPIALEDAPQRAIRSAIAIHREMTKFSAQVTKEKAGIAPFKMRIGIHTGPVVVGTLGNDLRVEFKAVGDTVNLASRVQGLAAPGTTYVTEETFKLTEGLFRFEALGAHEIKGKEAPVPVYQVIAPSSMRTRFDVSAERGLTPFVGRDRELEILLDGFERVRSGRGQAFSIVSEAGVGKSRLLYEFRKAVTNENPTFLEGRCLSYSQGIAYHPFIDILKANFDIREEDRASRITEKVKKGLKVLGVEESSTLPCVLELLSVEDAGTDRVTISPEAKRDRIVDSLRRIVLKGSEIRPLIVAFEDLYWVDKTSEEVLRSLLEAIPGARVLLIFSYRPEFVPSWGGKSFHSQLTLNRLSNRESLVMVTHLLDTESIDQNVEELILEKTEGVPFFIEEFVRSLKDLRIIEIRDGTYHLVKGIREVTIPSTIQDVIMARADSLPEGAKEVLQAGSVIGREVSLELLRRVTGLPEQELLSRLSRLKDSEFLYERGIYPETSYTFKHALTQEVAYNSLLLKRRKEIHEKIGVAIEELYFERLEEYCELLAYHYVRSDNKEKAVEYLILANQKAVRTNAVEQAKPHFDEAMKLLGSLPETRENRQRRISLLAKQTQVFLFFLKLSEYHEMLIGHESIAAEIGDPGTEGAFYAALGYCEYSHGSLENCIRITTRAAELCEAGGNVDGAIQAYVTLGWSHIWRGDLDRALTLQKAVLQKMDQRFIPSVYVRALTIASYTYSVLGNWDQALEEAERAENTAQKYSDANMISWSRATASYAYTCKCDLGRAIEYGELALEKAQSPWNKAMAGGVLAWALCRSGELRKGVEILAEIVRVFCAARYVFGQIMHGIALGEGHWLSGEYDKARETLEAALERAEGYGARPVVGQARRLLGEVALKTNPLEAAPHFDQAISIFREIKAENELALAYAGMGRLHKQEGDQEKARRYLTQALEIFERLGTLLEPDKVRKELGELPG